LRHEVFCAPKREGTAMTPELWYLLWSVVLTFILAVIAVSGATLKVGLPTLAGNREGLPEMVG